MSRNLRHNFGKKSSQGIHPGRIQDGKKKHVIPLKEILTSFPLRNEEVAETLRKQGLNPYVIPVPSLETRIVFVVQNFRLVEACFPGKMGMNMVFWFVVYCLCK